MLDVRMCMGCSWLHDTAVPVCRYEGWCVYKHRPKNYRTPEDGMRRETRDGELPKAEEFDAVDDSWTYWESCND